MLEKQCDLWETPATIKCITTNGIVVKDELVMGGGCALEARLKYPELPKYWGGIVEKYGNKPYVFFGKFDCLLSFPTKNHFKDASDLDLIIESSTLLMRYLDKYWSEDTSVLLPRPGCGLGMLDWEEEVKPAIENILDDRVTVIWR